MHSGYHIGKDQIGAWLPLLLPILTLHLILFSVAIWDLLKRDQSADYKWLWGVIIILINIIGPFLYIICGRRQHLNAPTSSKSTSTITLLGGGLQSYIRRIYQIKQLASTRQGVCYLTFSSH